MIYAQFYHRAVYPPGTTELVEATGDRSVVVIDARLKRETVGRIAADECARRGYLAWRIFAGESFTRSDPVSGRWPVDTRAPVRDPVWLRAHD